MELFYGRRETSNSKSQPPVVMDSPASEKMKEGRWLRAV
jgi:hypothetical protein